MIYFLFYNRQLSKKYIKRNQKIAEQEIHTDDSQTLVQLKEEDKKAYLQENNEFNLKTPVPEFAPYFKDGSSENNVWIYKHDVLSQMKEDMTSTMAQSIEIKDGMIKENLFQNFIRAVVKALAPML